MIQTRTTITDRHRVWQELRDHGPLAPSAIARRLEIEPRRTSQLLLELRIGGFVRSIKQRETVLAEVRDGMPYQDAYCDRKVAEHAERLREREAEQSEQPPSRPTYVPRSDVARMDHQRQRAAIVEFMRMVADATRDEICAATGLDLSSISWRIDELKKEGLVRVTDRTRKTRRGKPGEVLELTGQGNLF